LLSPIIFRRSKHNKVSHYVVFSTLVTPSISDRSILLNTLFSNTLSLHSPLIVSDQVSLPCKTIGKITVLYILIFKFLESKLEDKDPAPNYSKHPVFNLLLISSWIEFWFVKIVPKCLNSSTLSKDLLSIFIPWLLSVFWSRDVTIYLVLSAFTSSPVSSLTITKALQQHAITFHIPRQIIYCAYSLVAACTCTARFKGSTVPTRDSPMEHFCGHKHSVHHPPPPKKNLLLCFCTGY
jgi:hypothetical protein